MVFASCSLAACLRILRSGQARHIEQVLHEAELHGYAPLGLNAKLIRLEWKQTTDGSCPLKEMGEIERATRSHGLALIARRAALCSLASGTAGK